MSDSDALAAAEAVAAQAKAAYRDDPSAGNREAYRGAQTALREARWTARGGEGTYADHVQAVRDQAREAREEAERVAREEAEFEASLFDAPDDAGMEG